MEYLWLPFPLHCLALRMLYVCVTVALAQWFSNGGVYTLEEPNFFPYHDVLTKIHT